jgi:hypothetical protein
MINQDLPTKINKTLPFLIIPLVIFFVCKEIYQLKEPLWFMDFKLPVLGMIILLSIMILIAIYFNNKEQEKKQ